MFTAVEIGVEFSRGGIFRGLKEVFKRLGGEGRDGEYGRRFVGC
jgi:hypothetical protein